MTALMIVVTAGMLLLGWVIMRRIDCFTDRSGFPAETDRPENWDDPSPERRSREERRERLGERLRTGAARIGGKTPATRIITVGFAAIILVGALLLCLPAASRGGEPISFLNALFTATSATCVTGLAAFDTWSRFTLFGQVVILALIQIGGLGFMAVAIMFSLFLGRRIGLRERSLLAEALSTDQIGGVVRLVRRMLIGTAVFELGGAVLLAFRFVPMFGPARGAWYALFHSVSAFCNAGFDLMGCIQPNASLTMFSDDALVTLTIASLIAVGGIGFVVWNDLAECGLHWHKTRLHTRVALLSTGALIAGGAVLFYLLERSASMKGMGVGEAVLCSIFQSVTPRTAGYATVDNATLSGGGKLLTMFLMFVGACPGGTGGGVKTTTFVVAMAAVIASSRGHEDTTAGHYRLEPELLRRAFTAMIVYAGMALAGMMILCVEGASVEQSAFECLSAIGTVGLTLGITQTLPALSKIVLILLMFAGRVGSLTVFLAVNRARGDTRLREPVGNLIIG
jgi:trk system potassium uptake protein TrkH